VCDCVIHNIPGFRSQLGAEEMELCHVLFAVYMDLLIVYLRRLGLGCVLYSELYGCLLYADDILLMTHTVHAMEMMLHICDVSR